MNALAQHFDLLHQLLLACAIVSRVQEQRPAFELEFVETLCVYGPLIKIFPRFGGFDRPIKKLYIFFVLTDVADGPLELFDEVVHVHDLGIASDSVYNIIRLFIKFHVLFSYGYEICCSVGGGLEKLVFIDRKSTRLNSSHGYISYA